MKKRPNSPGEKRALNKQKKIAFTAIEQQLTELQSVGEDLWRFSEPPGEEIKSHDVIVTFLKKKGFTVQEHYMGFQTAFRAEFGEGELGGSHHPNVALLCAYDADPVSGHSRGNNLSCVVALSAALGLQTVIKFATRPMGKITVVGCPGNKDNTEKIAMFEANCFRKIDFLLHASPAHFTNTSPQFVGSKTASVTFRGRCRSDHSRPWETANPVNAVVLAYQNVSAARQQFKPDWTARAVITSAGHKADVMPEVGSMEFVMRAPLPDEVKTLSDKVDECMQAAGTASGCRVEIKQPSAEFFCNIRSPRLAELYRLNADLNGFTFHNARSDIEGPNDIANVSTSIPTLTVFYYSGASCQPGTDEFNRYAGSKESQFMSVVQGKTLAMLGVDLMTSRDDMKHIFEQHQEELHTYYGVLPPGSQDSTA